jgi:hypothetical protein
VSKIRMTDEQFEYFLEINHGRKADEVASMLNEKFGTNFESKYIYYFRKNHKIPCGYDAKFKKGETSHFKGKKLSPEHYDRASENFFKSGNQPPKTKPLFSERIGRHGNIEVKVTNNKWISKAKFIYEKNFGPIKKNEMVRFIDGKENYDINNLFVITKSANLIANKNHYKYNDPELQKAALNLAKLTDLRYQKIKEMVVKRNEKDCGISEVERYE